MAARARRVGDATGAAAGTKDDAAACSCRQWCQAGLLLLLLLSIICSTRPMHSILQQYASHCLMHLAGHLRNMSPTALGPQAHAL